MSAARWIGSEAASPNSLAITAASVYPCEKIVLPMSAAFPMTIVTAIVSPIARPRPSIAAPEMPAREYGSTAILIISQRVAPSASAASL